MIIITSSADTVGSCCLSITCSRARQPDRERTSEQMAHFNRGLNRFRTSLYNPATTSGLHHLSRLNIFLLPQFPSPPPPTPRSFSVTLASYAPLIACDFYYVTGFSAKPHLRPCVYTHLIREPIIWTAWTSVNDIKHKVHNILDPSCKQVTKICVSCTRDETVQ